MRLRVFISLSTLSNTYLKKNSRQLFWYQRKTYNFFNGRSCCQDWTKLVRRKHLWMLSLLFWRQETLNCLSTMLFAHLLRKDYITVIVELDIWKGFKISELNSRLGSFYTKVLSIFHLNRNHRQKYIEGNFDKFYSRVRVVNTNLLPPYQTLRHTIALLHNTEKWSTKPQSPLISIFPLMVLWN